MKQANGEKTEWGFLRYAAEVWPAAALLAAMALMTHGSLLFSQRIGIDTEDIIRGKHYFDGNGRQGLIWLGDFLETGWFSPYMVQALTILFLTCAPVAFGYVFSVYGGGLSKAAANAALLFLGTSFIVSPFWTEQLYFQNQSAQVTLSCVLTAVSIWLAEEGRRAWRTRWYCILAAVLAMQVTFASYQVLAMLYVTGVVMVFLCVSLREDRSVKQQLQWVLAHAGIFLTGLALYWVTAKRFFGTEMGYLDNQIGWGQLGIRAGMKSSLLAAAAALKSNPPYYTGFYGFFAVILFAAAVCRGVKNGSLRKERGRAALFCLALLFLAVTPFVFCFLYAGEIWARMQLVYPLAQGCMLYLTTALVFGEGKQGLPICAGLKTGNTACAASAGKEAGPEACVKPGTGEKRADAQQVGGMRRAGLRKAFARGAAALLTLAVVKNTLTDMSYCSRMYYTDEWRYQYDRQMAHDLHMELKNYLTENGYDSSLYTKLVFVGIPEIPYNEVCLKGQVIGHSFFDWDMRFHGIHKTRIMNFMRIEGYPVEPAPAYGEGAEAAYFAYFEEYFGERVDAMPSFPDAGSIQYLESDEIGLSYLVVKLGPEWQSAFE